MEVYRDLARTFRSFELKTVAEEILNSLLSHLSADYGVLMLAVLPEIRRKSIGRNLMEQLYECCSMKGYDTVILEVRKSNREAITFYELQGFAITGEIGNFYSNGEDTHKMMKVLRS